MKNKTLKVIIATLLSCFFVISALNAEKVNEEQAKEAWAKLNLYKEDKSYYKYEKEKLKEILESARFKDEESLTSFKNSFYLKDFLNSIRQTLKAKDKFDESWEDKKMWETYSSNLKTEKLNEKLKDIEDQKKILIQYATENKS
ncbi:MAG: hypothetical protein C5B43_04410 [Verrucomicrobia bacterium]|nr:MAG: hypothetical protein C5B43_04410 [Verrucomicrobiota bacterium]